MGHKGPITGINKGEQGKIEEIEWEWRKNDGGLTRPNNHKIKEIEEETLEGETMV